MKSWKFLSLVTSLSLLAGFPVTAQQQGPTKESSETVARPRSKKEAEPAKEEKIPSKYGQKGKPELPAGTPTFRSDAITVSVDVAVLDQKGCFIPGIPKGNFRVLEENVPQQISNYATTEAPMTVCLVIEFSNLFQRYWTETWYQTL